MQKLLIFFSKHFSVYAVFNDRSFNDIVSFEQLGPELYDLFSVILSSDIFCQFLFDFTTHQVSS